MYQSVCVPAALLALLVLTLEVASGQACPRSCNCYQANEVHCTFRSLLTIPPGLPTHTRRINLGFNSINRIHDSALTGLKSVELLMLHSNDLHHLPDAVFQDMKSLQILKLSYNKLREIPSSWTFTGLTSLLRLYLDHNLLQHIHPRALLQLPSLRLLRLQGNRLHQLHPHTLCTLSLLNTYYFSTLRHLDLSNNSLTTLPREVLQTAPLLETLGLQANLWSCDCRMNWVLPWSLAHAGRETPLETELSEIQPSESFREPLGIASLGLSDEQGNSVDLSCNITQSTDSQDIAAPPDLSISSSSPLPLALSLSLECPVERHSYDKLWRILAYYSETAVRLEREIMLSKAPTLAYRYKQTAETEGYYHTGVKASVKVRPQWLLQPSISIQLNRLQSNANSVHLIYSTRVSAHPDPTGLTSTSSPASHPWVLISTNHTTTALAAVAGRKVELPCPLLSSGNPKLQWILPDGSKLISPSSSQDGRLRASASGLLLQKVELSDAGIYYCIARAGRDVDILPLRLAVAESSVPPSGEKEGHPITGAVGEPVSLSCNTSGSPSPYMSWVLPDGNILRQGLAVSGGFTIQSNGSLSLLDPSLRDAGHYRCIVVNQYGSDSLSMQLEIKPRHTPPLRTSFPRRPQSAAGRSTKIRVPLLRQVEEGSGNGEVEEETTLVINRRRPRPLQPLPNRRYPIGKPRRRGRVREGAPRRGGGPVSSTEQRRNSHDTRHRITANKQRIDPLKWADLLAKIRQKTASTNNSQPITVGKTTANPLGGGKDGYTVRQEGDNNTEIGRADGAGMEAETEGSSVDDAVLQEEGLQPIYPVHTETQTHREIKTETEKDTEIERGIERSTKTQSALENETETHIQAEKGPHTETVTYEPFTRTNEIVPEPVEGEERETNPTPSRSRPHNPQQGLFPNLVPNARPQSQWISRRRIGQRRRIINRPRGRPMTPLRPVLDPTKPRSKSVTTETVTDQTKMSTTTSPATLSTQTLISTSNGVELNLLSPPAPNTPAISTSESASLSLTSSSPISLSPSQTKTQINMMTHSVNRPDTAESTLFNTRLPASTHSNIVMTETHMPAMHTRIQTHSMHPNTAAGKDVDRPPSKHSEELERNLLDVSNASQSSTTLSFSRSSDVSSTKTTSTTLARTPPTTARTASPYTPSAATTTMTSTSTRASSRDRPKVDQVNSRQGPVSGSPNQTRPPTDWKNPAANSIPDSHSSRPHRPPSPSLPAVPGAPVVRSRPRISDPHIRTVSFPAESTARLSCEAQGEPKPSITWTKVTTGAVISIHSKAQRFEVLPNGTLVIQNVQLQDRGTYICSAHSFLGRDRLLTTLEVWTRPPRMQLASYRETTIHHGGELHLECRANGVPTPLLSWVLPDRSVLVSSAPSNSRITMDTNGTLHISVTLHSDRGMYRCVASNSAGAASASVRVHMSLLPPVIQQSREEHLLLSPGMSVYVHCSARGAPPPTLRWRMPDGTLVRPSQFLHGNLFVLPNGTLHIRKVGPQDSGNYECTASNAVGTNKRTVKVEVQGGAEGERREGVARNERTKAVSTENLSPASSLLKTSKTLSNPSYPLKPLNTSRLSPLSPSDRSRSSPSSFHSTFHLYQHNSTNSPPTISKTVTVFPTHSNFNRTKLASLSPPSTVPANNNKILPGIVNNTSITSSSPSDKRGSAVLHSLPVSPFSKARIVFTSPSITTIHYGDNLQLHCSVTGNPSPIIIWRTPSRKLVDMHFSFDRRLKVHPNGTLSVQAVTEKDGGDYLCITRNKVADDYRLLQVSVVTKPAKIEPKQSLNQMVSFGKPLKVDCLASGLPDPAVRWSLPDGTMVNSVLQGEDRGGRARRLTVFDNGTLLVPAVGMGEEGEYTCYAENQGGQDTMKVKVKVMMTSPPTFTDDRSYHLIKVRQGAAAIIPCQATGNPAPTVMWFSPARRVIPRRSSSGLFVERLMVVLNGSLEVRLAQKIDSGNYTCRATNSVGERHMVVGLEVEVPNHGHGGQAVGRSGSDHHSRSGGNSNNAGISQYGFTNGVTSKLSSNYSNNTGTSNSNGRIKNIAPSNGINMATNVFNPALRSDSQNGLKRPVGGITTQFGHVISAGVSGAKNIGNKADNIGINRNELGAMSSGISVENSQSTVRGDSVERNPATNINEVTARKASNDASTSRDNGKISVSPRNVAGATNNTTNTVVAVVTTVKQQVVKGQNVLLSCPSWGSPPPRLVWLLPGNGVLPAPYYGSRLTVHRNGSLELRGVRVSDGGTLVCVVRGERGETRVQVELEVSDPQEETRSPHRGPAVERPVEKSPISLERTPSGALLASTQSRSALPEMLHQRIPVTQKPSQRGPSSLAVPHPVGPPPPSSGSVPEPAVSTRTASLVSIINGETLRLPCPAPSPQGSLSWTLPSGKVVPLGESGDSGQYLVQEDGTLIVQKASVFDRGTYSCRSTSSDSVSVVTVPVIVIAYPPRITTGPSPVTYTRPGVAVELPCLTIATPRATVTWETPDLTQLRVMGQARIYGNRYLSPQGSLVIQNPTSRDTGFYRCTAKNVIGVDTKATYLHVI
ncbi:hypothetical protein PAMA_003358 [Pampus argenteus]